MTLDVSEISLVELKKASKTLHEIVEEPKTNIIRDATIQRFEYTFELAWKTLKRYFEANNALFEYNVKNIIREAGKQGLVDSVEDWFEFLKARNETSHAYSEPIAEKVYRAAIKFSPAVEKMISRLEKLIG